MSSNSVVSRVKESRNMVWDPLLQDWVAMQQPTLEADSVTITGALTNAELRAADVPVSVSALPLPSGAATSAKQDTLLAELQLKADLTETQPVSLASVPSHNVTNAGTFATQATQSGTWTVQPGNTANTTAWKVDGSAVTQPISGTITANAGTGTFAISAASLPLPTGAATSALQSTINTTLGSPFQAGGSIGNTTFAATQATAANLNATVVGTGTFAAQVTGSVTANAGTNLNTSALALDASISTLNTSVNTLLKPANTLAAVTTVGTITNPVTVAQATAASLNATVVQATGTNLHVVTDSTSTTIATSATATNLKTQAEVYQGGVAVGTANPLYDIDYDPEYGFAWGTTSLRDRLTVQRYTVLSDSIADGLASFWTQTNSNGGTITVTAGEGLIQTSANAIGTAQISSTSPAYFPGQVAWLNSAIRFGDTGSVGNTRRIGAFTVIGTTPQDGFYYELSDTTLNAVAVKGGVATAVASTSWTKFATAPFTLDTNYHSFELRWTANSVHFYVDNILRHAASGGSTSITSTLNFPITIQSLNTSGATNRVIAVRNIGLGRFGQPDTLTSAGPLSIAKAEDAASTHADVGIPSLGVRSDILNSIDTDANGDYGFQKVDNKGRLWINSDILSALMLEQTDLLRMIVTEMKVNNAIVQSGLNVRDELDLYRADPAFGVN